MVLALEGSGMPFAASINRPKTRWEIVVSIPREVPKDPDPRDWDGPRSDAGEADGISPEDYVDQIDQIEGTRSDRAGERPGDRETGLEEFLADDPELDETDDLDAGLSAEETSVGGYKEDKEPI